MTAKTAKLTVQKWGNSLAKCGKTVFIRAVNICVFLFFVGLSGMVTAVSAGQDPFIDLPFYNVILQPAGKGLSKFKTFYHFTSTNQSVSCTGETAEPYGWIVGWKHEDLGLGSTFLRSPPVITLSGDNADSYGYITISYLSGNSPLTVTCVYPKAAERASGK